MGWLMRKKNRSGPRASQVSALITAVKPSGTWWQRAWRRLCWETGLLLSLERRSRTSDLPGDSSDPSPPGPQRL